MKAGIDKVLLDARQAGASDVHLHLRGCPIFRIHGDLVVQSHYDVEVEELITSMMTEAQIQTFNQYGNIDLCYSKEEIGRYRVNVFFERGGNVAAAIRVLADGVPSIDMLDLPPCFKNISMYPRGLVLITGPTGSGKSTTLAAMIDFINTNLNKHIISIEDPIEYMHKNKRCLINQREIGMDVSDVDVALRAALRQDPDVIMVGEMRDYNTISMALTAAETGHLVISTLHTTGAINSVDRIIDVFPGDAKAQVRGQLANSLKAVISQQLLPTKDRSRRVSANEIMIVTDAISNLIREDKTHMINAYLTSSAKNGMQTLDTALANLVRAETISVESAFDKCVSRENLSKMLGI